MSAKKMGLGRGFDTLIPTDLIDESLDPTAQQDGQMSTLQELPLASVVTNPNQPRRTFDELSLQELAVSIEEHGVIQPIVVIPSGSKFEIVAGERRFRATKIAGLETIPALVRTLSAQNKLEVSLIENLQRRDLNALETATAYLKLRDQFNLSLDQIGKRVGGKSVSSISNTLRLLRLPAEAKRALQDGLISEGQARPLIGADDDVVLTVLPLIVKDEWSARRVEQYMANVRQNADIAKDPVNNKPVTDTDATKFWQSKLNTKNVSVKANVKGAGQVIIKFKTLDELTKIQKLLG